MMLVGTAGWVVRGLVSGMCRSRGVCALMNQYVIGGPPEGVLPRCGFLGLGES